MLLIKWVVSIIIFALLMSSMPVCGQEEKTYSISLVKTANLHQKVHKIGDKKVLVEPHKVKEGEHVWQILRDKGLLQGANIPELLTILKKLNKSFKNLDLIHPGEKLLIPLKIVPIKGGIAPQMAQTEVKMTVPELEQVDLETYTVQPGDNIIKIVTGKFSIPPKRLYTEYLNLVKKLNPAIKDLNRIYPGQQIKIPIYSPQVVRRPIEKKRLPKRPSLVSDQDKANMAWEDLRNIFTMMGEEWIQEGEHFIPLRSGGQVDLKASSFPVLSLLNDKRIIVDIYNKLPDRMAKLIKSSWGNYRVVHLEQTDDLRKCLDKILRMTGYPRILGRGQPLELKGEFPVSVSGDWVIVRSDNEMEKYAHVVVLTLMNDGEPRISFPLRQFLAKAGIKIIEYPEKSTSSGEVDSTVKVLRPGNGTIGLIRTILDITGHKFKENIDIPIYGNQKKDFNLIIKADLFFRNGGKDTIIDLSGLGEDLISFLNEHQFQVLSLSGQNPSIEMVAKVLNFLGVPNDEGVHSFMGADRDSSRNIKISVKGVVFSDPEKRAIFAIPNGLPIELQAFLHEKGFRLLEIHAN